MANSTSFEMRMEDGMSGPAQTARQALAGLRQQLDRSRGELASMNRAMREMKAGGDTGSKAMVELQAKIDAQKKSVSEATGKYVELGGTFRKVRSDAEPVVDHMEGLRSAMSGVAVVGGAVAGVVVTVAAAMVAMAAGAAAASVALLRYGIASQDARRSEALRLEGLTRLRTAYGQVGGSSEAMQAAIDRVSDSSSASRGTLEGYISRIHRLGLRGDAATAALEGAAMRGEVLGSRYAESFIGMAAAAARSGRSVRALADDVRARLGDVASARMMSLDVLTTKWRENMASLFRGVKIDGFLKVLQEIVRGFSQSRVTGRALAGILERMFNPLNAGAEGSVGVVRTVFERMILSALRVEGAFLSMQVAALRALTAIGFKTDKIKTVLEAVFGPNGRRLVDNIVPALVAVAAVLTGITAGAVAIGALLAAPFIAAGAAGYALVRSIMAVQSAGANMGKRFREWFAGLNMRRVADDMITGMVTGLITGTTRVVAAVTSLADSTVGALREALEIRSPSRVFARLGREVPRGMAVGIEDESAVAQQSVTRMIDVSMAGDAVASAAPAAGAGASVVVHMTVTSAATSTPGFVQDVSAALAEALEGMLTMQGAT